MAEIRQYIGARYVFKIYENSQDPSSAEWEPNVTFEPLTIVTYLNSTYASKKDVPGSIGNPADNPLYWVVTGAYNGQIATLQQQIDTINNTELPNINLAIQALTNTVNGNTGDIADIKKSLKKRYLIIGDSYSQNDAWQQYLNGIDPNLVIDDNIITVAYGGTGFTASNDGYTFETMLSLVTTKLSSLDLTDDDISDIVFLGGVNDNLATSSAEQSAITSCLAAYKLRFPNATYHFVMCATHGFPTTRQRLLRNIYPAFMSANGVHYPLAPFFIHSTQEFQTDMLHPNTEGMKRLARYFYNAVIKGIEMMNARFGQAGMTAGDSGNTIGSNSFETNVQGNKIVLSCSGCNITFGSDVTWIDNAIVYIGDIQLSSLSILPTVDNGGAMSGVTSYLEIPITLRNNDAGLNVDSHGYMVFDYNTLSGGTCHVYVTPGGGSTPYNTAIKAMTIGAFTQEIYY